jgi:two-component system, cell cycle sensor histidine kinase and response regulator CckA
MMKKLLRKLENLNALSDWRNWFPKTIAFLLVIIIPVSFFYRFPMYKGRYFYFFIVLLSVMWLLMFIRSFIPGIALRLRNNTWNIVFMFILYALTISVFIAYGPNYVRPGWLMLCAVIAALFYGVRGAIIAPVLNIIILLVLFFFYDDTQVEWSLAHSDGARNWLVFVGNMTILTICASLSVGFLIGRLNMTLLEERRAKEELQESEKRYRLITENTADMISILDMNLRFTYVSPATVRLRGFTVEEAMEQTIEQVLTPESVKLSLAVFEEEMQLEASGKADPNRTRILEVEEYKKEGSTIWVEVSLSFLRDKDGKPAEILMVSRDITERRQAEEKIKASEERFRQMSSLATEGIMIRKGNIILDTNKAFANLCGYNYPHELIGKNGIEIIPFTLDSKQKIIDHIQSSSADTYDVEIIAPDGSIMFLEVQGQSVPFPYKGEQTQIVFMRNITERKEIELALQKSEDKYRHIVENAPIGIFQREIEGEGKYHYVNPGLLKQFECNSVEEFLEKYGLISQRWAYPEKHEEFKELLIKKRNVYAYEMETRPVNGKNKYFSLNTYLNDTNSLIDGFSVDICERKQAEVEKRRLEERLQRAEKMEALGQLAGGVAHDLNNVLGVLTGYSELLLHEIPEGQRARGHVEKILQSTEKGAAIIQDLLTLARRGVTVSDVINLNSVVSGFLQTPVFESMKDYHSRIIFRTEYEKNLLNIKGSPVHLEKTLMNLVLNAAESISGTGEVTIRTESRYLDKPLRGYDEVKEGDYAVLTVADTGMGIPAENREKIFEPFYTKKTMGRSGTGLGLAIVWGTIKDHNGYIDLQTEVGEGTTFTLYFPITRDELVAPQKKEAIERYMGNGESVLVIDDIAEQRDVASGLLTRMGYKVHVVSSGEEAVEYLKKKEADILVLDMIMEPGIDGLETYERVLKINPQQKAILVSGFSVTDRVKEAQKLGAGAYVKKPYIMEQIGMAIRDELNR